MDRLRLLRAAGVSIWAEDHRPAERAVDTGVVEGVRIAAPTVDSHRHEIRRLGASGVADPAAAYLALVLGDVQRAARDLETLVELPCPADVARDARAMVSMGEQAVRAAQPANVAVGLPGTTAGLAALQELTYRGISTAVDGVYCGERHGAAAEAYTRGLERRLVAGLPLDRIASLTWIRVSRLDEQIDRALPEGSHVRGAVGLAVAQSIYLEANRRFCGPRWRRLARRGANPQRAAFCSIPDRRCLARLALPGAVVALRGDALDSAPGAPAEVDETEVTWVLREAAAAGTRLRRIAAELRCATDEQSAFTHRAVLAAVADELRPARGGRMEWRAEACR